MVDENSSIRIVNAERCEIDDEALICLPDYTSLYILVDDEDLSV